ncbi:Rieske (2Fe-2S) protein [Paenibacillus sp.]|uniref:Rieske (2Fe-2S) protein n=1 Tax=Paenibacillus sp. TaxID=58172 RepID=UPI0028111739|nr:Rieske (2Fe-2S) protein [Paenibacillus sp.]
MAVHYVLDADDVPEGGHTTVLVEGRDIVVYRIDGQFYALHNYCPHQGAPLCRGLVSGTNLPSDVYRYEYGREREIVRCPWHGWEFEIKTGKSLFSDRVRVKKYETDVLEGKVGIVLEHR